MASVWMGLLSYSLTFQGQKSSHMNFHTSNFSPLWRVLWAGVRSPLICPGSFCATNGLYSEPWTLQFNSYSQTLTGPGAKLLPPCSEILPVSSFLLPTVSYSCLKLPVCPQEPSSMYMPTLQHLSFIYRNLSLPISLISVVKRKLHLLVCSHPSLMQTHCSIKAQSSWLGSHYCPFNYVFTA